MCKQELEGMVSAMKILTDNASKISTPACAHWLNELLKQKTSGLHQHCLRGGNCKVKFWRRKNGGWMQCVTWAVTSIIAWFDCLFYPLCLLIKQRLIWRSQSCYYSFRTSIELAHPTDGVMPTPPHSYMLNWARHKWTYSGTGALIFHCI